MAVRVGVDVGGTFTKAVACDAAGGRIVARAVVPTTHAAPAGVAEGVAHALAVVAAEVERTGAGPILLVAHSTTQAVNGLLEGDTATVGVLGIGRRPDLERTRRRTALGPIGLAPGRSLRPVSAIVDATDGLDDGALDHALGDLVARGAEAVAVSAAFGAEDPADERRGLDAAARRGLPACAGHELSGLYGLELRTVTAAINASILPRSLQAAGVVESAVRRIAPAASLLVMRGDGGAADLAMMRRRPLVTAFSGPAASVAGALRRLRLVDAIVVEVGGTSTNVAMVRGGRPVLSYVRVLEHQTCVRSLDVRVVGAAGGSLLRLGRRLGRLRLADVGPRSAHIAGLAYAAFASPDELAGAEARLVAPRAGDPAEYVVVETPHGRRFAPTVTCAANALGEVVAGSYAAGDPVAARLAFEAVGRLVGESWDRLARRVLDLASAKVADTLDELAADERLRVPTIVGVGGAAGALVPAVAGRLGLPWEIAPDAEVLSSIGDATSLIRVEIERGLGHPTPAQLAELHREAEIAALAAGAAAETLQVESEPVPERGAVRVVALGSIGLLSAELGAGDDAPLSPDDLRQAAEATLGTPVELAADGGHYALFVSVAHGRRSRDERPFVLIDRRGGVAASGRGLVLVGPGTDVAGELRERLPRLVRHIGPVRVAPAVRLVRGPRLIDLSVLSKAEEVLDAALAECAVAADGEVVALVGRG